MLLSTNMTNQELWQAVLAQIQIDLSPANFSTWFKNTDIINIEQEIAQIGVPNSFVKEWLENKYHKKIFKILHETNSGIKNIEYIVKKTNLKTDSKKPNTVIENQLTLQELNNNKETNLNPKYLFENLVVGPFNELPYAAATAVAENPGNIYNPFFLYGGVGLGKTHILQAIGNQIAKNFKKKNIKYISSERFTTELISSIHNRTVEDFKNKYKKIDVLIIDDIQFLSGREKTQEEFFHIFNILYEKNRQIIVSSDRPPKSISYLAERLRSRFEGGMTADISLPDLETRIAILKAKAIEKNTDFSNDVYNYLASLVKTNIRELEGALNRLIIQQKMNNNLSLEEVKKILKGITSSPLKIITPKKIIETVAEFFDLKEKDLLNKCRKKEIVRPRQIAMYLLRQETKNSFPFIGRKFGGKDHTTAIHACKKIAEEIQKDKKLEEEIFLIKERLLSSS
ncbi:MAG: chromosomal replication initiator protein DnaA [Candidatus Pacebacteria bacterium]|nr:chromosomal replication initiator protein DnaA [Candidatus Paceibacterota bacterium]